MFANDGREEKQRRVVEAKQSKRIKKEKEESIKVATVRIKKNIEYFVQIPFS